jgi:hypothetical protein
MNPLSGQVFASSPEALSKGLRTSRQNREQPELWQDAVQIPIPPEQLEGVKGPRRRRQSRPAFDESLPRRRVERDLSDADNAGFKPKFLRRSAAFEPMIPLDSMR